MNFIKGSRRYIYSGLIATLGIVLVSEGVFGEGLIGAGAMGAASGLLLVFTAIAHLAGARETSSVFISCAAVFVLGAGVHLAAVKANMAVAHHRLGLIASAAENYKNKYGKQPESLDALAPEFISRIPRAKYTLMFGQFYLADNKIMFMGTSPIMTFGYDLTTGKRVYSGYKGMVSIFDKLESGK